MITRRAACRLTVSLAIVVGVNGTLLGCRKSERTRLLEQIEAARANPKDASVGEIASLCREVGAEGVGLLSSAVRRSQEVEVRLQLVKALLECDTNNQLIFAIDALTDFPYAHQPIADFLEGRLDETSRAILQTVVRASSGKRQRMAIKILVMICDDPQSLEIAGSLVRNETLQPDQLYDALNLLGTAAYYNNDASAVELIRPYLKHERLGVRVAALTAMHMVPGVEAEQSIEETLEELTDAIYPEVVNKWSRWRADLMRNRRTRAPGWREDAATTRASGGHN